MNKELLELLNSIDEINLPIYSELFAGANLIITNDKTRNSKVQDIIVYSKNAETLSWLVFKLKEIFKDNINSVNKYEFYTHIGRLMNESIDKKLSIKEQMKYVLKNLGEFEK